MQPQIVQSIAPFWQAAVEVIKSAQPEAASAIAEARSNAALWRSKFGKQLPRVKLMVTARRRPDVSVEFFHDYWLNHHGPLVARVAPTLRIQRYVQNHSVDSEAGRMFLGGRDAAQASFDGLAEGWWANEQDLIAAFTSAEGQKASALLAEDERNFCSTENLVLVAYEYEFVGGPAPSL